MDAILAKKKTKKQQQKKGDGQGKAANKKDSNKKQSKTLASTVPLATDNNSNKNNSANKQNDGPSSIVYLGHLPAAFEENELRAFLSQFGTVTRVRVARAKRSHRSRGFAFCEFDDPEVANVVADTMSGYLMGQRRIVCNIVPPDKIHRGLFRQHKKVDFVSRHRKKVLESTRGAVQMKAITARLLKREKGKKDMLKQLGIDYDFPGFEESNKAFPVKEPEAKSPMHAKKDNPKKDDPKKDDAKKDDAKKEEAKKDDTKKEDAKKVTKSPKEPKKKEPKKKEPKKKDAKKTQAKSNQQKKGDALTKSKETSDAPKQVGKKRRMSTDSKIDQKLKTAVTATTKATKSIPSTKATPSSEKKAKETTSSSKKKEKNAKKRRKTM